VIPAPRADVWNVVSDPYHLPRWWPKVTRVESEAARQELLEIRHSSLYAPRDFDISPYFELVKPTITCGFDYRAMQWADRQVPELESPPITPQVAA